jgi:RNA polymerase sigma-70 factor (ECF subfamily)
MTEADPAFLLSQIANGDKTAFTAFYRAFERPVYRFITSKLNDPHEAHDILHEVFMEIWRSAGKFEGRSTVRTWLFGIAYRKTMDRFRKGKRVTMTDEMPEEIDESVDTFRDIAAAEEAGHVRHCLDELKSEHRLAVEMAFFHEMSYREIAEATYTAEGTVKTRVFHAKKLLMRCLSGRLGVRV